MQIEAPRRVTGTEQADYTAGPVLTNVNTTVIIKRMTGRRITANLPADLLDQAMKATGRGITETLIAGLERLRRADAYRKAMTLKGRIQLAVDLDTSRERRRR